MKNPPERPHGMDAIRAIFGDPLPFLNQKEAWETKMVWSSNLPTPLIYAYDQTRLVNRVRTHRLLLDHLVATLMACLAAGVPPERLKYGGSYCWRGQRGNESKLSLHTWAIAVDIEPAENPLGKPWSDDGVMLDRRVIDIFKELGWFWGGDFNNRDDAQHFQWASGA